MNVFNNISDTNNTHDNNICICYPHFKIVSDKPP